MDVEVMGRRKWVDMYLTCGTEDSGLQACDVVSPGYVS
jgi:hypothetical protein